MRNKRKLSKRELQVFELLIQEKKGKEIAEILGLNEKTVGTYKLRIQNKLQVKTIVGMYLHNEKHNLVELTKDEFLYEIHDSTEPLYQGDKEEMIFAFDVLILTTDELKKKYKLSETETRIYQDSYPQNWIGNLKLMRVIKMHV